MTENRFRRRSISLDDASHAQCKTLAESMALSVSAMLRVLIKQACDKQSAVISKKQEAGYSGL